MNDKHKNRDLAALGGGEYGDGIGGYTLLVMV